VSKLIERWQRTPQLKSGKAIAAHSSGGTAPNLNFDKKVFEAATGLGNMTA